MNIEKIKRYRKESRKNHNRFYTSVDMAIIKKDADIRKAKIKRGEIVPEGGNEYIAVCGCGMEGCFMHGDCKSEETQERHNKMCEMWPNKHHE